MWRLKRGVGARVEQKEAFQMKTSIRGLYRFRKNHVTDDKRGLGFSAHVTDSFGVSLLHKRVWTSRHFVGFELAFGIEQIECALDKC